MASNSGSRGNVDDHAAKRLKTEPPEASVTDLAPIVPFVKPFRCAWKTCKENGAVFYQVQKLTTKKTVACFDLGGTLFDSTMQFPRALPDYELWNRNVISMLQDLYDSGCNLMIIYNHGGIRKALTGVTATKVKNLVEWLCCTVERPISAFISTSTKSGFHKPSVGLWKAAEEAMGVKFDVEGSLFVGDGVDQDDKEGEDVGFARNVSQLKGGTLKFHTPTEYFGPSSKDQRTDHRGAQKQLQYTPPPDISTRCALSSGCLRGPILLILCGPQGSGKSYFCNVLTKDNADWAAFSQDTIRDGKPGKREAVESATESALKAGKSVVVDRMHLDQTQRHHFYEIGKSVGVPVHALVLTTPADVVAKRVLNRADHIVKGESGAKLAKASWAKIELPKYEEGFSLISASATGASSFVLQYRQVRSVSSPQPLTIPKSFKLQARATTSMPSIALGTFKVGKRIAANVVSSALASGFKAIDSASTYNNEKELGLGGKLSPFLVGKVPKRATSADQVKEELHQSLANLNCEKFDLLLLHWPSDVIAADTLQEVWLAMESCAREGKAKMLGVSNFNVASLRMLLPLCSLYRPVVNQIERHPLLPQWDLIDFCAQQDILLQAHSPLGQGMSDLLENTVVADVANSAGCSAAQVLVRWNLQQQVAVVTKCSSEEHMSEIVGTLTGEALSADNISKLNAITERKRFVNPPFMCGNAPYCWAKTWRK